MLIFYHCFFIYWLRCFSKEKLPRTIFSYPAVSFMWERQNTLFFISFQHNELILYHIPWVITELFKMFLFLYVSIHCSHYLYSKLCHFLTSRNFINLAPESFWQTSAVFGSLIVFLYKIFQDHLRHLLLQNSNYPFLQGAQYWEIILRDHSLILGMFTDAALVIVQCTELGNT